MARAFEYGGYNFVPERKLTGKESGFFAISKRICTDTELGFCEEGYAYPSKFPYSHKSFMEASTDKECDLYRCVENGRLYIPCQHDLQIYRTAKQKEYNVTITEILRKTVTVEAESREEAEELVSDGWHRADYILDAESFKEVSFEAEKDEKKREEHER